MLIVDWKCAGFKQQLLISAASCTLTSESHRDTPRALRSLLAEQQHSIGCSEQDAFNIHRDSHLEKRCEQHTVLNASIEMLIVRSADLFHPAQCSNHYWFHVRNGGEMHSTGLARLWQDQLVRRASERGLRNEKHTAPRTERIRGALLATCNRSVSRNSVGGLWCRTRRTVAR